jgi:TolA-binding protein
MLQNLLAFLAGGQIQDIGIQWLIGAIAFLGILGVVLGVFLQIKKIKRDSEDDAIKREEKIREESVKEMQRREATLRRDIETETALRDMKGSIDRLADSFQVLGKGMEQRVERLETDFQRLCQEHSKVEQATKSAHKRIDEHRRIEHKVRELEEATNGNDKEGWLG